jgi:cytochrome c553
MIEAAQSPSPAMRRAARREGQDAMVALANCMSALDAAEGTGKVS